VFGDLKSATAARHSVRSSPVSRLIRPRGQRPAHRKTHARQRPAHRGETAAHLWAERFDKPVADLFEMQDEIVSRLANQLGAAIVSAEARRAERKPDPDAFDLCLQGMAWFNKGPHPAHLGNILELGRAEIGDLHIEPPLDLPVGVLGKADRAGPGDPLQPRRDVDPVAQQVSSERSKSF